MESMETMETTTQREFHNEIDLQSFDQKKKLMCIEYPGLVQNVDKMINTLGGLENIGIAYSSKNRRIELRFRPDDKYCKPACGERQTTTALVLRVRVKTATRQSQSAEDAPPRKLTTYRATVVGVVDTIFKFNNLCDFQYLPMHTNAQGKCESIHDKLYPRTLPNSSWLRQEGVPLFLTPPLFSRFDTVHYYDNQKIKDEPQGKDPASRLIGRTRKRRQMPAILISHKDENVPRAPPVEYMEMMKTKHVNPNHLGALQELFRTRPMWLKNALIYHTDMSKEQMKLLLPMVAYHFTTGPWRITWVRYGYDPRTLPETVVYQTLDFRLRAAGGFKSVIKAKRSCTNYLLPYKSAPPCRPKVAVLERHAIDDSEEASRRRATAASKDTFTFRPGTVPPFRQMFYQYCDIEVPEVQAMLAKAPQLVAGGACDTRFGWLPPEFERRCREIVSNLVAAELRKQMEMEQRAASRPRPGTSSGGEPHRQLVLPTCVQHIEISDSDNERSGDEVTGGEDDTDTDSDELAESDLEENDEGGRGKRADAQTPNAANL